MENDPILIEVDSRAWNALIEAAKPFARIKPSTFYAPDGSEEEGYFAFRALLAEDKAEFTGKDLANLRNALQIATGSRTEPVNGFDIPAYRVAQNAAPEAVMEAQHG